MTKKSTEEQPNGTTEKSVESVSDGTQPLEGTAVKNNRVESTENSIENIEKPSAKEDSLEKEQLESKDPNTEDKEKSVERDCKEAAKQGEENVQIEYRRASQENIEIIKDVDQVNSPSDSEEVCLRRKNSSGTLSRSDSFSVKDEIEKIEKQIKALETRNSSRDSSEENEIDSSHGNTRQSIQANRRHFFENMVENENNKGAVKIEFKELPREQKDIHVVRLTDSPIPVVAPGEPVKVIELHISEPIRQKPEILDEINPIPKPRRHSSLNLNDSRPAAIRNEERKSLESARGKSF